MGKILGVVLAGGLAHRMGGGDKSLRPLAGRPILSHILDRLVPQVDGVVLNANGDPARFAGFGLPVIGDPVEGFVGPLAGVLAGMAWAQKNRTDIVDIVTVPGDGPFLPRDLVSRLLAMRDRGAADLACAASDGQPYPVLGLWPVSLFDDLRHAVVDEGVRKVSDWTTRHRQVRVDFPVGVVDPFFNANTPEELAEAERLLMQGSDLP